MNEEAFKVISEVDRLRPCWFVMENVSGMGHSRTDGSLTEEGGGSYASSAIKMLMGLEYVEC